MAEERSWPPIILYGVIINQAIKSGDKDVMQAVAKVSKFMMDRVESDRSDQLIRNWHDAHEELMKALN